AMLGQKVTPVDSVGIYVPGGTAAYPSSVIMNACPAKVAGVPRIVMAVPCGKDGKVNPYVLVTAKEIGVKEIYKMGGAQAVAALAFGTETVPKVEKITGPGNIFVTLAKKAVYGHCDIDMLAGPSEILIIADETADPTYLAADLLSQAEHDPLASAILVTDSEAVANAVAEEIEVQLAQLPRQEIAATALANYGKIILANDMATVIEMANISAPEHLEVMTKAPFEILPYIRNAGAIFLGQYSPEPLGDYYAGPNHILPTGGTAKFYSVLNVETFMKKTSIIAYTGAALAEVADDVIAMAEAEGLRAHANAIRKRVEGK
ncbi:MAG: histidinol dehydrogenase, partial [Phascolarctobacterium sp.]|nr:histidinol dehydrogenase [Phascolarctobacterium sp.]